MSACFLALTALLSVSTVNGYHDAGSSVSSTAMLRADQVSSYVEIAGQDYRKGSSAGERSKAQAVTVIHTLDGTRYEVDMSAKTIASLPCVDMPERQGNGKP